MGAWQSAAAIVHGNVYHLSYTIFNKLSSQKAICIFRAITRIGKIYTILYSDDIHI